MEQQTVTAPTECSSPPPAAMPPAQEHDPGARLHELARELLRNRSRALLLEYLRLRKSFR